MVTVHACLYFLNTMDELQFHFSMMIIQRITGDEYF